MWSAIKTARWYALITVLLFLIFLIVYLPAQFAWKVAEGYVPNSPVRVLSVSGSVWQGQGVIDYQNHQIDIEWSLDAWSLLTLAPSLTFDAAVGNKTNLKGIATVSDRHLAIDALNGELFVPLINPYLKAHRVSGDGIIKFYDLTISLDYLTPMILNSQGRILWQGAQATYPGPKGIETVTLPDIVGRISLDDKGSVVNVLSGDDGSELASIFVMNQGWAGIKVRKRSVDLVGQTWVGNQQPDDVIFQVREKLW